VAEITEHAPGLRTLSLQLERPAPNFKPGQFLHLALDEWDPSSHWPESRPFSIASAPENRTRLDITVSAVGAFTQRLLQLELGATVWLKLPLGEFVVQPDALGPTVLVAGGTGVTPFVSLLSTPLSAGTDRNGISVLYGARRPELLIYRSFLEAAVARGPGLSLRLFCEEGDVLGVERGRLTAADALAEGMKHGADIQAVYYLSGPPAMIASLREGLIGGGVSPDRIRVDAWA